VLSMGRWDTHSSALGLQTQQYEFMLQKDANVQSHDKHGLEYDRVALRVGTKECKKGSYTEHCSQIHYIYYLFFSPVYPLSICLSIYLSSVYDRILLCKPG
jgi:hypothetical protein